MTRLIFLCLAFLLAQNQNALAQANTENWKADLTFIKQELPKRSPELFIYYPQAAFEADLNDLSARLAHKTDLQIALELQAILAKTRDLSTRLELTPLLQKSSVIPVGLGWYADGLYVSATVKKFAPALGKRVLEINGLKTEEALERIGRFFGRENDESPRRDGPQFLRFPEVLRMAGISKSDTLAMLLVDEKGQRYFINTHPIDFRKDKTGGQPIQFTPKSPDLRWDPMKQMFSINWLEADSIVYVQYNACFSREIVLAAGDTASAAQFPPFQPVIDSVLTILDQHPGARFFFDLRFNNSGNPYDGIRLAEQLGAMPFVNLPNRLYVAVNRYTAGAALEIAANFQAKTNATLIGDPPGQRPNHMGNPFSFTLPGSRIQVFYGSRRVHALPGDPDNLRLNQVIELPFQAFRDGRDPVLDFVREH